MADTKVSDLTAAAAALVADEVPTNEAGTSKKLTVQQLLDLFLAVQAASQGGRLRLTSTQRVPLPGTLEVRLEGVGTDEVNILGQPRGGSFTVPTDYFYENGTRRLTLSDAARATMQGTAKLDIIDDFSQRSRLTLSGTGGQ